ncbi:MAG: TatD family hydrolase [Myxococcales bacterium]
MSAPFPLFDAHLHADGLSDGDLTAMAEFGVKAALVPARDAVCPSAKDLVAHFEELIHTQARRLKRIGIRPFAALGVHPSRIPWHGLEEVLAAIPRLAAAGRLVAIGEIGLDKADPREEQVFGRQLELARELNLPVVVRTPERDKPRVTRRALALLRETEIEPAAVLVDNANAQTIRTIRECGFVAGLSVNPMRLTAEEVAGLIHSFGSEALIVSSDAGDGAHDILSLPRTAAMLEKRGLCAQLIRRVMFENAIRFLRIDPSAVI